MTQERRKVLRRKYLSLGAGELVAAAVFVFVAVRVVIPSLEDREVAALCCALVPLLAVLVQAGAYWLLARRWVLQRPMPATLARLYRVLRAVDGALLLFGLVGIIVWFPHGTVAVLVAVGVWTFGLIEYVNYFFVRLSYPIARWIPTVGQWRRPQLMKDVEAARE